MLAGAVAIPTKTQNDSGEGVFEKFSNFVASKPGKLNMDMMNEWRRSVGLPLQAEPVPNARTTAWLIARQRGAEPGVQGQGCGVQIEGPFAVYGGGAAGGPAAQAGSKRRAGAARSMPK